MTAATANSGAAIPQNPAPENPLHRDYFTRAIPEPYRVLGLRLRPLSVGRYRLLQRFGVAFVAEGKATAGVSDLLLGVLICSMKVDEFGEFASSPSFEREIRRWSRRVFPAVWLCAIPFFGKYWRQRHAFNVIEKINLFENYIQDAQKIPRYTSMRAQTTPDSTGHWSHSIEICLRSELGWTADEINEAPLSKALADYFRHAESQGSIKILSDEDFANAEHNAARIAAALAEQDA